MFINSNLFKSRWKALIWAGGVLWLAVELVGPAPSPPSTNAAVPIATE